MPAKSNLLSTEFLFSIAALICATVLLITDDISEDTWKWVLTTVGAAYVLGRSAVKAVATGAEARVAAFKSDLATLAAATPSTTTNVTNVVPEAPARRRR